MLQAWRIFKWLTVACSWASPQIHTLQSTRFFVWLSQSWDLIKLSLPYLRRGCLGHHPPGTGLCFADRNGAEQIWPARQWPRAGDEHHLTAVCGTDTPVGTWQSIGLCSRNTLPLPGTSDALKGFLLNREDALNEHPQLSQNNDRQKLTRTHGSIQRLIWSLCYSP